MISGSLQQMDSCENRARFSLISSGAKILIFRKCRKHFGKNLDLRRIFHIRFCQQLLKTLKMRLLAKSHFSQMILPFF